MARGNFGERLKRERELREVSIDEVVLHTRISARFLQALENEDWGRLPGGVFNRGFVRSVARYLGLDEESLLAEYDVARAKEAAEATPPPENRIPSPPKWIPVAAACAALLVIAGLIAAGTYGWRRFSAYRQAKPVPVASQSVPGSQPAAAPATSTATAAPDPPPSTAPASRPLDLSVSASAATRVRVLADGKLVLDAELRAGETRHFSATQRFEVTAADSSAVLLELNGRAMPPLGSPGASGRIVLSQKDLR
jgi:cytoskeletal protein RodZ